MFPARYQGIVVCGIIITSLIVLLLAAFVTAYCVKWEPLMLQVQIQKDNVKRAKQQQMMQTSPLKKPAEHIQLNMK